MNSDASLQLDEDRSQAHDRRDGVAIGQSAAVHETNVHVNSHTVGADAGGISSVSETNLPSLDAVETHTLDQKRAHIATLATSPSTDETSTRSHVVEPTSSLAVYSLNKEISESPCKRMSDQIIASVIDRSSGKGKQQFLEEAAGDQSQEAIDQCGEGPIVEPQPSHSKRRSMDPGLALASPKSVKELCQQSDGTGNCDDTSNASGLNSIMTQQAESRDQSKDQTESEVDPASMAAASTDGDDMSDDTATSLTSPRAGTNLLHALCHAASKNAYISFLDLVFG